MFLIAMYEEINRLVPQDDQSNHFYDLHKIATFLEQNKTANSNDLAEYMKSQRLASGTIHTSYLAASAELLKLDTEQLQQEVAALKLFLSSEKLPLPYFSDTWDTNTFFIRKSNNQQKLYSMLHSSKYWLSDTRYNGTNHFTYEVTNANILHMFVIAKKLSPDTSAFDDLLATIEAGKIAKMLQQRAAVYTASYGLIMNATPYRCLEHRSFGTGQNLLNIATRVAGLLPLYEYFNSKLLDSQKVNPQEWNDFCKMMEYLNEKAQGSDTDLIKELKKLTWSSFKKNDSEYYALRTALFELNPAELRNAVIQFTSFTKSYSFDKQFTNWGLITIYGYLTKKFAQDPSDKETLRKIQDFAEIVAKLRKAVTEDNISIEHIQTLIDKKPLKGYISTEYYNLKADLCTLTPTMLQKSLDEFETLRKTQPSQSENPLLKMFNEHYRAALTKMDSTADGIKLLRNPDASNELYNMYTL